MEVSQKLTQDWSYGAILESLIVPAAGLLEQDSWEKIIEKTAFKFFQIYFAITAI